MRWPSPKLPRVANLLLQTGALLSVVGLFGVSMLLREASVSERVLLQQVLGTVALSMIAVALALKCNLRTSTQGAKLAQSIAGGVVPLALFIGLALSYPLHLTVPREVPFALTWVLLSIGFGLTALLGLRLLWLTYSMPLRA
jgi:hypothetical protein